MSKEAEEAQPVVDGDQQDAVPDQGSVLVERARGRAALIGAAVKPEHDRKGLFCRPDRGHYIEKEAIFLACLGASMRRTKSGMARCAFPFAPSTPARRKRAGNCASVCSALRAPGRRDRKST